MRVLHRFLVNVRLLKLAVEVLINVDVGRDIVQDELDDEEDWVLARPIELLVISHVPLILRVTEVEM